MSPVFLSLLFLSVFVAKVVQDEVYIDLKAVDDYRGLLIVQIPQKLIDFHYITLVNGKGQNITIDNPGNGSTAPDIYLQLHLNPLTPDGVECREDSNCTASPLIFNSTVRACNLRKVFAYLTPSIRWEMSIMGDPHDNHGKVCADIYDCLNNTMINNLRNHNNTEFGVGALMSVMSRAGPVKKSFKMEVAVPYLT